jgi:RNA polymerase sigma-70 factor (ECF subfamily)
MQEQELLTLALKLDHTALAEIYDRYSPGIYRYAYRLLDDAERAEECVSETFVRFLNALQRRKGPRDYLKAYLYRIAHNWITDQYRMKKVHEEELDENYAEGTPNSMFDQVLANDDREKVRNAIRLLTPDQQQVIMLKYLEDWGNEEIGRVLNKPVGAVKSLQSRALASLQRILIKERVKI